MKCINNLYSRCIFVCCILLTVYLNGCEDTFDPVKENDRFIFSMYGYLDSSEDEQWIRVVNLQEEIDPAEEGMDGIVTLENLESGETTVLNDSLFQYSENYYAYNFWGSVDVEPNGVYQLRAERSDGAFSSVIVEMPDTFRANNVKEATFPGEPDVLTIWEVENLAEVSLRFNLHYNRVGITEEVSISLTHNTISPAPGEYDIYLPLDIIENATRDLSNISITDCEIYVANAGPDWHDFPSLDPHFIALPEGGISNVEMGTGYVVGVVSKRISYSNSSCTVQEE